MFDKLADIHEKLSALERQLSDPELVNNQQKYQEVVRDHSRVSKLMSCMVSTPGSSRIWRIIET